jgi:hypothetical protein
MHPYNRVHSMVIIYNITTYQYQYQYLNAGEQITMPTPSETKYRPSLTRRQIAQAINLAQADIRAHPATGVATESLTLLTVLIPYLAKIDQEAITPSHVTAPKMSLLESLGEAVNPNPPELEQCTNDPDSFASKDEYWKHCYDRMQTGENLSVREINAAREHMYLNDLMTDEEIFLFESQGNNGDITMESIAPPSLQRR